MREFQTPEQAEKFLLDFVKSDFWQYIKEYLDKRMDALGALIDRPEIFGITRDGMGILIGRQRESRVMQKLPDMLAQFASATMKPQAQTNDPIEQETLYIKTHIPDVITGNF